MYMRACIVCLYEYLLFQTGKYFYTLGAPWIINLSLSILKVPFRIDLTFLPNNYLFHLSIQLPREVLPFGHTDEVTPFFFFYFKANWPQNLSPWLEPVIK